MYLKAYLVFTRYDDCHPDKWKRVPVRLLIRWIAKFEIRVYPITVWVYCGLWRTQVHFVQIHHVDPRQQKFSHSCRLVLSVEVLCKLKTSKWNAKRQTLHLWATKIWACYTAKRFGPACNKIYAHASLPTIWNWAQIVLVYLLIVSRINCLWTNCA